MPKRIVELQLYRLRLGLQVRRVMLDTHIAVESSGQNTMDEAHELAEGVCEMINGGTGMEYAVQFLECVGVVYVWK